MACNKEYKLCGYYEELVDALGELLMLARETTSEKHWVFLRNQADEIRNILLKELQEGLRVAQKNKILIDYIPQAKYPDILEDLEIVINRVPKKEV